MHTLFLSRILLLTTALSLPFLTLARPPPPNSECPSSVGRQALTRRFFESVFEQPQRNHTSDALNFYDTNINVVDNTTDYPSPDRGVSYPPRNLYAWNRDLFLQEVSAHIPWPYYGVISSPVDMSLTNAVGNIKKPCYIIGGLDVAGILLKDYGFVSFFLFLPLSLSLLCFPNDPFVFSWLPRRKKKPLCSRPEIPHKKSGLTAWVMNEMSSGHKTGDVVEVKVTAQLDLMDDDTDHIGKVTYHVDWSQWYATLPTGMQ